MKRRARARARIGDEVTAVSLGWTPPDFLARDVRVRGFLIERHCARMVLIEFPRGGMICRGWCRAATMRRVGGPQDRDAGAVAGVSWAPLTY